MKNFKVLAIMVLILFSANVFAQTKGLKANFDSKRSVYKYEDAWVCVTFTVNASDADLTAMKQAISKMGDNCSLVSDPKKEKSGNYTVTLKNKKHKTPLDDQNFLQKVLFKMNISTITLNGQEYPVDKAASVLK